MSCKHQVTTHQSTNCTNTKSDVLSCVLAADLKKSRLFGSQRDEIPHPQVATDVIEELCFEMGLQRSEALDEYAVFLVTHRGNAAPPARLHFAFCRHFAVNCAFLTTLRRSERASAQQTRIHPGHCDGGGASGQQLQSVVPEGHLEPGSQTGQ